MRNYTLLLTFLFTAIFTFGQTTDFDPIDVSVLKAIRDNAAADSPLKTEWANESAIGSWVGVKWTDTIPKKVKELEIRNKNLLVCDFSKLDILENLYCSGNPNLTLFKISGLASLKYLEYCCGNGNSISTIDLSGLLNLEELHCSSGGLTNLNLNGLSNLRILDCRNNHITSLDLNGLSNLFYFECSYNLLTSLDLSGLTSLAILDCSNNQLPFSSLKTTLYLPPEQRTIAPQNQIFKSIKNAKIGDVIDFSSEAMINGKATVFTWYKNGNKVEGTDQSGKYKLDEYGLYCTMANANFPGLTLTTQMIRPSVVDNSAFFPPARTQQNVPDCSHFSLIYYLKSAIWNRKFNRNPKLEENQFSHTFVWNQNINPIYQMSDPLSAFYFMKNQGCATIADFPLNEASTEIKPSLEIREKALAYKSKRLFHGDFMNLYNSTEISKRLESLKDSLIQGKCFSLSFSPFGYFLKLSDKHNVYSCYNGISYQNSKDSLTPKHVITIVGYNDTIKTALGRGAFKVINSNTQLTSDDVLYFDYNWFYTNICNWDYWFLEEDFSSQAPKVVMSINLSGAISGVAYQDYPAQYLFCDTLRTAGSLRGGDFNFQLPENDSDKVDFADTYLELCLYRNQVQVFSINGSRIKLRSNLIFFPFNNTDGNYELLTDLSSRITNFQSLSVIVFDPISATYVVKDDSIVYSYVRESKIKVNQAYLKILESNKNIQARIIELPDTTIISTDFYSLEAYNPYRGGIYKPLIIKSCTSVLKRKLITFNIIDEVKNIDDICSNTLNIFPNPIGNYTTVKFSSSKREIINLGVFNYLGQQVAVIANREFEAGTHQLAFDGKDLPDGIYLCCIRTSAGTKTVKLIKSSGLN